MSNTTEGDFLPEFSDEALKVLLVTEEWPLGAHMHKQHSGYWPDDLSREGLLRLRRARPSYKE